MIIQGNISTIWFNCVDVSTVYISPWTDINTPLNLLLCLQCSIPFSVDDITNSIQEKDFTDVKPAEELLENPAFQFLQD